MNHKHEDSFSIGNHGRNADTVSAGTADFEDRHTEGH